MTTLEKEGSQPEEKEEAWNISHFWKEKKNYGSGKNTVAVRIWKIAESERNMDRKKGKSWVLFWFSYVKELPSGPPKRLFFD